MHWFTALLVGLIGLGMAFNVYTAAAEPSARKRVNALVAMGIGGLLIAGLVVYR